MTWLLLVLSVIQILLLLAICGWVSGSVKQMSAPLPPMTPLPLPIKPRIVKAKPGRRKPSVVERRVADFVGETGYAVHVVHGQGVAVPWDGKC